MADPRRRRILVTGGAGFIGSHVTDAYLAQGHDVWVIDDFSSGRRENVDPRARMLVADIRSREAADLVRDERIEVLNHHAAQMDVRRSVSDPVHDAGVNILGFINLLAAGAGGVLERVIFASSGGAIYGEQEHFPAREDHPTHPLSPYGCSKLAGEAYLGYFSAQSGITTLTLRYGNVYGPRQNPHGEAGVVAIFIGALLGGGRATVFGSGEQTRDYVYVGDVVAANLLALETAESGVYNIGSGVETSVNEVYRQIAAALGASAAAAGAAAKSGEQLRSVLDASRARAILGWPHPRSFADGIAATLRAAREAKEVPQ